MTKDTHIHDEVTETDLQRIFKEIREDVEKANSREELNELYNRTGYMITLTHASPVKEKFGGTMKMRREIAEQEFTRTVLKINSQAKKIGTDPDYSESWEGLASKGYEAEGENLLEPENADEMTKE